MSAVGRGPVGLVPGPEASSRGFHRVIRTCLLRRSGRLMREKPGTCALAMKWDGSGFFPGLRPAQKLWSADLRRVWSMRLITGLRQLSPIWKNGLLASSIIRAHV